MQQSNLFIALGGLLILALMLASVMRRYQEVMAERRMRIKRIMRGVDLIRAMLERASGCPLPVELEKLLVGDVLARFQKVREIDANYQGIDEVIGSAEQRKREVVESKAFEIRDKPHLHRIAQALAEIINFLQEGGLLTPLTSERSRHFIELIGTLRAECVYRYHLEQAKRLREAAQVRQAIIHCNSIRSFIKQNGPSNDQVKAWCAEADELINEMRKVTDPSAPAA
jgi:hypothetical protein